MAVWVLRWVLEWVLGEVGGWMLVAWYTSAAGDFLSSASAAAYTPP